MKTPEQILMAMGGFLVTLPYLKAPQRYEITAKLQQILQEDSPTCDSTENPDDMAALLQSAENRR